MTLVQDFQKNIGVLEGPILIIGASGFIGANLLNGIFAVRGDVYGVVKGGKGWRLTDIPDDNIIAVDINDKNSVKNLIQSIKPKIVFDCKAYGAYSFETKKDQIYQTNFIGTVNLVEELADTGIRAYVHAGSSSEYGVNSEAPLEGSATLPNSDYAVSKVAVSEYLKFKGKLHNFPCVNLRLYSVYGPLEDPGRLVPTSIFQAIEGKFSSFVNPETTRDFVYVDDVCNAFALAATHMNPSITGESLNIGTGKKTSIKDYAELVKKLFHVPGEPTFGSMHARSWDLPNWYSNSSKASETLGWVAKTELHEGLVKTADWVKTIPREEFGSISKQNLIKKHRSISAIVACYKDGDAIPIMYQRLTKVFQMLKVDYEIIFVNDASPDNSSSIIQEISRLDQHVVGITHSRNFGSQMAFRSGMEIATKDSIVLLDGDLQDPPELIKEFYSKWVEGYDVIYGVRVKREMPFFTGLMYKSFYRIFSKFSYISIPLDAGDFSLIDRRVVGWLLLCSERDLFLRGLRAYVGFKQIGVNYIRPERMFGKSTNNLLKNIGWAKKGIFSFSDTPLTLLTFSGIILLIGSILLGVSMAILRILYPDIAPKGLTTVLIFTLFFGSLNLFGIGLVGEYVSKIILEVKQRPRLIRTSITRNGHETELLPDSKNYIDLRSM